MNIKDRITLELTLKHEYEYEKTFGYRTDSHTVFIMEDAEGQQYKWDTTGTLVIDKYDEKGEWCPEFAHLGDTIILKGTVKDFSEYKGTLQVVLTRCQLLEITDKAPTKEEIEDQKKTEQLASLQNGDFVWNMPYRQYKEHYADCETIAGSYETHENYAPTISVIVRNGRLKASGVRGEHFSGYELQSNEGHKVTYRAVSEDNALKRAYKEYPTETWECVKIYCY